MVSNTETHALLRCHAEKRLSLRDQVGYGIAFQNDGVDPSRMCNLDTEQGAHRFAYGRIVVHKENFILGHRSAAEIFDAREQNGFVFDDPRGIKIQHAISQSLPHNSCQSTPNSYGE